MVRYERFSRVRDMHAVRSGLHDFTLGGNCSILLNTVHDCASRGSIQIDS
jgi:hypothetical protein